MNYVEASQETTQSEGVRRWRLGLVALAFIPIAPLAVAFLLWPLDPPDAPDVYIGFFLILGVIIPGIIVAAPLIQRDAESLNEDTRIGSVILLVLAALGAFFILLGGLALTIVTLPASMILFCVSLTSNRIDDPRSVVATTLAGVVALGTVVFWTELLLK